MKSISLLALAALASTASAQTRVTLYGLVDVYVARFSGAPSGVNATHTPVKRLESGGMTTSRWGVRGTEELGDGLSAGFELSSFLRVDGGQVGRSDAVGAVAADPFWSREASVNIADKQLGRIRLGNFSTPMFSASLGNNAFLSSTAFSPLNVVTFIGGPLTGGSGWTNQVGYDSPTWDGISFTASVSAAEGQGGRNSSAGVYYEEGPWKASAIWQSVKKNPLTFADGTSPNNTKAWQLAASYDLKAVKVFAHAGVIQNDGTEVTSVAVKYKIWELSASVPMGRGSFLVAYAKRKTDDTVAPVAATVFGGNKKREVYSAGYDHFISKRTDLYAVVMHDSTVTSTLPGPGRLVDASATNFGVGIRQSF
ncbi:porin [Mitsuaria sp. 7]|uniref:porin n=1 Tax=Mitsuaria sp. 7 TaxID=1658665 RepID=UPI0007DDB3AA|nr:porin [Mitsuaria sp. 7]ANH66628.1 porin [Mitsuaria sp. 7]